METILTAENNIELEAYKSKIYVATGDAANAVMYVPQSLTEAQRKQARANIGAGTSSFSGSYDDLTKKPTIPSLDGYATEIYVDNAIANASIGGGEIDLSAYAKKTDIPTQVSAFTNDAGYLTEHQSLEGYALKSDIPDVSNYQTREQVEALIAASIPPSSEEVAY